MPSFRNSACAAAFCFAIAAATAAPAQQVREGLTAVDLFGLADEARSEGRVADAEAMYRSLAADPDVEIRAEARFRLGMMLSDQRRFTDAAVVFRALLDEKPDAARVRIELARVLAELGDEAGARRQLRQVQAAGLPPEVALAVDQFAGALRARKPIGGSVSFAIVPDSNINRSTDAQTLDTVIAPIELSEDARARSGLGVRVGAQGYARIPLGPTLALLPRLSGQAELYRQKEFNDVSGSASIGLELVRERDRFRPSLSQTVRWFGGRTYALTQGASLNWVRMIGRQDQIDVTASAARADYRLNDPQDGELFDFTAAYERAFDQRSGGSVSLAASRQTARDPGFATTSGGVSLLYYRDVGRFSLFGSATVRRLVADERLFLFNERRRDWLGDATLGASSRHLTFGGFAPLVRASFERNASTVGIYDYRRFAVDIGITRAF